MTENSSADLKSVLDRTDALDKEKEELIRHGAFLELVKETKLDHLNILIDGAVIAIAAEVKPQILTISFVLNNEDINIEMPMMEIAREANGNPRGRTFIGKDGGYVYESHINVILSKISAKIAELFTYKIIDEL